MAQCLRTTRMSTPGPQSPSHVDVTVVKKHSSQGWAIALNMKDSSLSRFGFGFLESQVCLLPTFHFN